MTETNSHAKLYLGIVCITLCCLAYTGTSILVKQISTEVPVNIILFFRYGLFLLALLPLVIKRKAYRIETRAAPVFLIRGLCGLIAIGLFLFALQFISIATATVLSVSTPLFAPFILRIFRGVPIIPKLYWGLTLGLIGVIVIIDPSVDSFNFALLIALASAVFRAGSSTAVRALSHQSYSPLTMLFYYFLVGTIFISITVPFNFEGFGQLPWAHLVGIAAFGALYQIFLTMGYSLASVRLLTPFTYLSVVFAVVADWVLWDLLPSTSMFVGMGIVIVGIALVLMMGKEILDKNHSH